MKILSHRNCPPYSILKKVTSISLLRSCSYQGNVAQLVRDCYGHAGGSEALQKYMTEVYKLSYTQDPDYAKLRKIFKDQLSGRDPRKTLEWLPVAQAVMPVKRASENGAPVPAAKRFCEVSPVPAAKKFCKVPVNPVIHCVSWRMVQLPMPAAMVCKVGFIPGELLVVQ